MLSLDAYAQVDIKRLAKDLKSRDPETRAFAAKSLGYHESPDGGGTPRPGAFGS